MTADARARRSGAPESTDDLDRAARAAELFARVVGPWLDRYLEAKRAGASPDVQRRAQRAYERAHGRYNAETEESTDG